MYGFTRRIAVFIWKLAPLRMTTRSVFSSGCIPRCGILSSNSSFSAYLLP